MCNIQLEQKQNANTSQTKQTSECETELLKTDLSQCPYSNFDKSESESETVPIEEEPLTPMSTTIQQQQETIRLYGDSQPSTSNSTNLPDSSTSADLLIAEQAQLLQLYANHTPPNTTTETQTPAISEIQDDNLLIVTQDDGTIVSKPNVYTISTSIPVIYSLNNILDINNVSLSDSISDLQIRTNIISNGMLTVDEFIEAQKLDKYIVELMEGHSDRRKAFKFENGIYCKKVKDKFLPILPQSLETFLFNCQHNCVFSGHRSIKSIITDISEKFYVNKLDEKVKKFCKDCYICQKAKSQNMRAAMQGEVRKPQYPRQMMSFDIFSGLETSQDGYKYVYSFLDNFSLYVINIPAKTKTTDEILSAFLQVFAIWSQFPDVIFTDGETGLTTSPAKSFFDSYGILHDPGPGHSPWRNIAEGAAIRKTKNFLRSVLMTSHQLEWTQALNLATVALNNTKTMYKYSPAELFFGAQTRNKQQILNNSTECNSIDQYFETVNKKYKDIIQQVKEARQKSTDYRTAQVNKNRQCKNFDIGQLVWLKQLNISPHRATKIMNQGPFKILDKVTPLTYKLARISTPNKLDRISHASHLEPFRDKTNATPIDFPNIAPLPEPRSVRRQQMRANSETK